jgi:hypothetical protein
MSETRNIGAAISGRTEAVAKARKAIGGQRGLWSLSDGFVVLALSPTLARSKAQNKARGRHEQSALRISDDVQADAASAAQHGSSV